MTKKDYVIIATAIAQGYIECREGAQKQGAMKVLEHVSHALKIDNERFQEGKSGNFIRTLVISAG